MNRNPFDPRNRQRRFDDPQLTRRILDRTTGRACGRAEDLLVSQWDGSDLETIDGDLLAGHLEHCAACRELDRVLAWLPAQLPQLAERDPGPAFTEAVLARTVAAPSRQPVAIGLIDRLANRLDRGLRHLWQRPRFALEAAWTAAALATIVLWSPIAVTGETDPITNAVRAGAGATPTVVNWTEDRVTAAGASISQLWTSGSQAVRTRFETVETAVQHRAPRLWSQARAVIEILIEFEQTQDEPRESIAVPEE